MSAIATDLFPLSSDPVTELTYHEFALIGDLNAARISAAFGATLADSSIEARTTLATAETVALPSRPRGLRLRATSTGRRLSGFVTEQRWQGYVTHVSDHTFKAIVYDLTGADQEEIEEVELDRLDVHALMRDSIKPGAIFFWDIGYEVDPGDQRNRKSIVTFPTIHRDTKQAIETAKARAYSRFEKLGWGQRGRTDIDSEERTSG
jgi:hypothetical protein